MTVITRLIFGKSLRQLFVTANLYSKDNQYHLELLVNNPANVYESNKKFLDKTFETWVEAETYLENNLSIIKDHLNGITPELKLVEVQRGSN